MQPKQPGVTHVVSPQLAVTLAVTSAAVMHTVSPETTVMVSFLQVISGPGTVTVTVALQVSVLPQPSVTVNVTVLGPTLVQLNPVLFIEVVTAPQRSLLPPSTLAAVMVAVSFINVIVMFLHIAVGAVVSITLIVWLTVSDLLPHTSVANHERVTLYACGQLPFTLTSNESMRGFVSQLSLAVGAVK